MRFLCLHGKGTNSQVRHHFYCRSGRIPPPLCWCAAVTLLAIDCMPLFSVFTCFSLHAWTWRPSLADQSLLDGVQQGVRDANELVAES